MKRRKAVLVSSLTLLMKREQANERRMRKAGYNADAERHHWIATAYANARKWAQAAYTASK